MALRAERLLHKQLQEPLRGPGFALVIVLATSPAMASTDPSAVTAAAHTEQIDGPVKITVSRTIDLVGAYVPARRATVSGATIVDFTGRRAIRILSGPDSELVDAGLGSLGRQPVNGVLTSRFGLRWHPLLGGYRQHSGVDLAAPSGAPVRATSSGRISAAGWQGGYGLLVAVDHGKSTQSRYGHLSRIAVAPGQEVKAGDVIGFVGTTGLSTGPHLHYEVRVAGIAVNPRQ
jgi:murein DD-endopeptidase MepM/ murein hydrolase activator NlpD